MRSSTIKNRREVDQGIRVLLLCISIVVSPIIIPSKKQCFRILRRVQPKSKKSRFRSNSVMSIGKLVTTNLAVTGGGKDNSDIVNDCPSVIDCMRIVELLYSRYFQ